MGSEKIIVNVDPDLEDLIPGFLGNRNSDLQKLRAALDGGETGTVQSIGHSLKGVGGGYGFSGLSEIGAALESAAKGNDSDAIRKQIDALADYLARVEVVFGQA